MKDFFKTNLRFFISTGIALLLALAIILYESCLFKGLKFTLTRLACDGFFISAVMFICAGALTGILRFGGFDAINYASAKFLEALRHPNPDDRDSQTYYDYVQKKKKERKTPFIYLLVTGGLMFIFSLIISFFC